KYCGCTEATACQTPSGPCSWIPGDVPVCTNIDCLRKHHASGAELPPELLVYIDSFEFDETDPPITEREATAPIGKAGNLPGEPLITDLVVELNVLDISPDPEQPREDVDDDLSESIDEQGVLSPVHVRPHPKAGELVSVTEDGDMATVLLSARIAYPPFMLINGERRLRGSIKAGRDTIPAIVKANVGDAGDLLLQQVTFNEGKRLAPMEEAKAWKRIMDAKGWNIQQLATALGRAKSTVSDRLAMLNAPVAFQPFFEKNVFPVAAAPIVRKWGALPERVLKAFAKDMAEDLRDFMKTETPAPLSEIDRLFRQGTYRAGLRNITHQRDAAKNYGGQVVEVEGQQYAVDAAEWEKHNAEFQRRQYSGSRALTPAQKASEDRARAREAAERKQQRAKAELRRAQFDAITAKLPGSLGGSVNGVDWTPLLVELVMEEVHQDTLRVLAAQLQLTGDKARTGGMSPYRGMIKKHAATLGPPGRLKLALQLLLAPDLNIPSYVARGPERLAAAAKLARVDLKKVKAPDLEKPVAPKKSAAPKRVPGKPDFMQPQQPDAALGAIVGLKPMPRTEITKKLWSYIKKHGLQDKKERRMINADEKLKIVFGGKSKVSMFEMTNLVNKHIVGPSKGGRR
ncbi:MAG TPA: SWIB/MDM2 domain-containing protein, partial [Gemmatimonadaceae bacterium]|nr:SWIB/MDM2 domain-containing protein [Gemmatimonadaceae bacterium]